MPLPLPPGWDETQAQIWESIRKQQQQAQSFNGGGVPPASSAAPQPAAAGRTLSPSLEDKLAALRKVDDSELQAAAQPGFFSKMGTAFMDTVKHPASIATDVAPNFAKGAVSGASLGLSEFIPGMSPDPESWAGSVGNLAGMLPTAMGGAGLVGKAGVKLGAKFLQKQLVKDAIAGGAIGVIQPRVEAAAQGKDEDRSVLADAAVGAGVPIVGGVLIKGAKKLLGIKPPINTDPNQPFPNAGKGAPMGTSGLSPEVQKDLDTFIKTGQVPPRTLPRPENYPPRGNEAVPASAGFPMSRPIPGNTHLVADTAPLGPSPAPQPFTGEAVPAGAGFPMSRPPGSPAPQATAVPAAAIPPTGPPAEPPLGGTPGPSPASTPDVAAPTIWSTMKDKARQLAQRFNLPIRVLSKDINMATPEGQLVNAVFNAAEGSTDWIRRFDQAYQLKAPKGMGRSLWQQMDDKARLFWRDALAANQGNEAGAMAQLAQYPDPQIATVMQQFTQNWNRADDTFVQKAVQYGLMKMNPDGSMPRIMNHLPFLRYRAIEPKQVKVEIGNEMQPVSSYFAEHPRAGSFMTKQRKQGEVPNWDMNQLSPDDLVAIKMKSMAQMFANHEQLVLGGLGDAGQTAGPGGKPAYWIDNILNSIQDPEKREYAVRYVNNMFGRYDKAPMVDPRIAAQLRRLQFYHLISGNLLTPLVNLTQTLFTYSKVSTSNFGKAFYLLAKNPSEFVEPGSDRLIPARLFAEKYLGASGTFNKADEELMTSGMMGKIGQTLSEPFRWSERVNQQHAALSGYLEGISRGMPEADAIQFGKNLNRITQQFGGRPNTPEIFRTPGMSLIGQFKSFQIGMAGLLKDMVTDAGQGMAMLREGDTKGLQMALPLAKYMTAVGVLGGLGHLAGDHAAEGVRQFIQEQANIEIPKWTNNGFLGLLGVNLANQIGMGALPATNNARDILWFLPGPLISHVLDAASVAMAMADSIPGLAAIPRAVRDRELNFAPTVGPKTGFDAELSKLSQWGPMTSDTIASKVSRSLPFAGPQIDKIRKWAKASANGNAEVEALDALQAIGWEIPALTNTAGRLVGQESPHGMSLAPQPVPATGTFIRRGAEQGPLEQALGVPDALSNAKQLVFQPQGRYEDIKRRAEEIESGQQYTAALRTYHSLITGGKPEEAQAFADQFRRHAGYGLIPSAGGVKAAWDRRLYPSTERLERGAAWPLEVSRRIQRMQSE